ncbi:hypothetical protein MVEN_02270900 [Mycena venus]|uniref:Ankyrin repeat protein n=1 Tax=Mycena venus TaxID=2733690 RepID=A0A8H6X5A4_9AGAR|nr:hypothetical protein MVEN_02270900 [Mycena venus]
MDTRKLFVFCWHRGADINAKSKMNNTALQAALLSPDDTMPLLLIENGADANAERGEYGTALEIVSRLGRTMGWLTPRRLRRVRLLLEHGADITTGHGLSLLEVLKHGDEAMVKILIECGADISGALQAASSVGHETVGRVDSVEKIEQNTGINLDARTKLYGSALRDALEQGHTEIARLLLQHGVSIKEGENFGNALEAASRAGHEGIVRLLIERSPNIDAQRKHYVLALWGAIRGGHTSIARLLTQHGADVNGKVGRFGTALCTASMQGDYAFAWLLLENRAKVDLVEEQGYTALYAAASRNHYTIVDLLIRRGADVNADTKHYGNALYVASWHGHDEVAGLLIDRGAAVNAMKGQDYTALHAAASQGHIKIVRLLLDHGADVNATVRRSGRTFDTTSSKFEGYDGLVRLIKVEQSTDMVNWSGDEIHHGTALYAAISNGHDETVRLLTQHVPASKAKTRNFAFQSSLNLVMDVKLNGKRQYTLFVMGLKSLAIPAVVTDDTTINDVYDQLKSLRFVPTGSHQDSDLYFTHRGRRVTWTDTMESLGLGPLSHLHVRCRFRSSMEIEIPNYLISHKQTL